MKSEILYSRLSVASLVGCRSLRLLEPKQLGEGLL